MEKLLKVYKFCCWFTLLIAFVNSAFAQDRPLVDAGEPFGLLPLVDEIVIGVSEETHGFIESSAQASVVGPSWQSRPSDRTERACSAGAHQTRNGPWGSVAKMPRPHRSSPTPLHPRLRASTPINATSSDAPETAPVRAAGHAVGERAVREALRPRARRHPQERQGNLEVQPGLQVRDLGVAPGL